ncbi:rod shape-determining protein RodA [Silanimonas sp.]|uniref:rod shape-determining protein RodA n=1 Tax=Silanimonas sp. TaxID=1929290 RepID=UPI001BBD71BD|nr:rod shape-determining protein RodA [Silanimonas sp.]MBS3895184.1 rod shape-determining protein RodA [Silanimonas sp.]MBS3924929.1 rod shape-determining protein RodA [Xanthomonadaceae bacterium]
MSGLLRWLTALAGRLLDRVDGPLLAGLLAIMAASLLVQASAADGELRAVLAQGVRFAVGLVALLILSRLSPTFLREWTPLAYLGSLGLIGLVFLFGQGRSADLWLDLGVFYLQPGELLKLSVPMMAAWFLHQARLPPGWRSLALCAVIIGLPVALTILQPDLGTGLLVGASGVFVVFLAGIAWWRIALFAGIGLAALPVAWQFLMPYQKDRVLTFLDPESDPLGAGWNIIQSKIAIGSGGIDGKGWGQGTQAQLDFLPEHTTDFVFSVFAEEFGWIGVLVLLGLYLFVTLRGLWLAAQARDTYSRLLAGALTLTFSVYVVVNAGMVAGFLPVVGVPMPLLSYGGTSAVSLLAGFGIVMAAGAHRRRWGG